MNVVAIRHDNIRLAAERSRLADEVQLLSDNLRSARLLIASLQAQLRASQAIARDLLSHRQGLANRILLNDLITLARKGAPCDPSLNCGDPLCSLAWAVLALEDKAAPGES